jgi:prophage regulatory protein
MQHATYGREIASVLPQTGYVRLRQIIGDPNATPPIPPVVPVCKTTWWAGVKSGRFPKPCKPFGSLRATFWRVEDIRALISAAVEVDA